MIATSRPEGAVVNSHACEGVVNLDQTFLNLIGHQTDPLLTGRIVRHVLAIHQLKNLRSLERRAQHSRREVGAQ